MKKRVLSLLLIRCLSLGLLPAGALAAGTQTVKTAVTVDYGAAIEAVEYLNQLCREAGLHDLVMDENLVKSAITRAEMVYHLWQLAGSPDPFFPVHPGAESHSLGRGGKHHQRHQHHHRNHGHHLHARPHLCPFGSVHLPLSVLQLIVFIPEAAASGIERVEKVA